MRLITKMKKLTRLFSHDTDKAVNEILDNTSMQSAEAATEAKKLADLLKQNGVTLQIYIATGGDRRGH